VKGILFDKMHHGMEKVMELRKKQHALTAANLANTDTPHYKAKYIRFDQVLGEVMGTEELGLNVKDYRHFNSLNGDAIEPSITEIDAPPWALDGNSVQIEREMIRLRENSVMFNAVVRGMTQRIARLQIAIGGS
jgi:flagellar basal-body rod protein FlgB